MSYKRRCCPIIYIFTMREALVEDALSRLFELPKLLEQEFLPCFESWYFVVCEDLRWFFLDLWMLVRVSKSTIFELRGIMQLQVQEQFVVLAVQMKDYLAGYSTFKDTSI